MSDSIMSNHPYSDEEKAEAYAEAIASGRGWVFETAWLPCRRCKQGFFEVIRLSDTYIPTVCGNCEMQLRQDCQPACLAD